MQYNKAEERKAWDDIAFRLGVVVVVLVGRVRFGIGDCAMRAAQSGLKVKGWSDLKRDFYVHDCRGAVPWPFDVVLGAIESS